MGTPRPLFNSRIKDLEDEFNRRSGDLEFLKTLLDELQYRTTERALKLKAQVLEKLDIPERQSRSTRAHQPKSSKDDSHPRTASGPSPIVEQVSARPPRPFPAVANAPDAIIDAWTALEVLSPPPFRNPEALAGGDRRAVAWLDRERLPWEGNGEKARPKTQLYYQIVLGSIDLEAAAKALLARYTDSRVERPSIRGKGVLAVVILDRHGRLVEEPVAAISSFGWGVAHALRDDLTGLSEWGLAEVALVEGLSRALGYPREEDEESRSLGREEIAAAYEWLVTALGLPGDMIEPPRFAIRSFVSFRLPGPPDPVVVNSFFLKDLAAARRLFTENRANRNLRSYIGLKAPRVRHDLLQDQGALEAAISPARMPPARWPGPGRHSLVLLQQAAVNLALHDLSDSGILAVNGPPGTGKTTLLRDIAAAITTARAEAMLAFDDPAKAFVHSGERLRAGGSNWLHLYRLDASLKGYEMIVASSNNRAVENVSAELPALNAIANDAGDLRYFKTASDALLQRDTWGLVAAVLGNAGNRAHFKQKFWWDDDVGFSRYLAAAAGTPQLIDVVDPDTGVKSTRPPLIVKEEGPPRNHEQALQFWREACDLFRAKLNESKRKLAELEKIRALSAALPSLAQAARDSARIMEVALSLEFQRQAEHKISCQRLYQFHAGLETAFRQLAEHDGKKPGFWIRLFNTRRTREWRTARDPFAKSHVQAQEAKAHALQMVSNAEQAVHMAAAERDTAERHHATATSRNLNASREVAKVRERIGGCFVDTAFFAQDSATLHNSVPWLDAELQRVRDSVFVAAMTIHKAFIDAAAKPLKHNLGVLMNTFGGRSLPTAEKRALMLDLWSSLFLVVPLVSTTFASVGRMFGDLPTAGFGWLLVDEAGQAPPQAAVGALMRTRRAVVVGDPVQIEPVVVLPDILTQTICRHFGVDPDRFNAPEASVQTLADSATPYFAEFSGVHGSRTVGVPLLVHRRCSEPMFSISNVVAYERLMVNAKVPQASSLGDILGPSAWLHVEGTAIEKWCPEEGELALELLGRLAAVWHVETEKTPSLFIVTPFVVVAENLRRLIQESGVLANWADDPWSWVAERVGTIHTVQGREAEAVLFVLGAPAANQRGARNWAGGRPNLLNVAVTRAKERVYVIGNRNLWREAGLFRELDAKLADWPPAMTFSTEGGT